MNSRLFCQVFIGHLEWPLAEGRNVSVLMSHSAQVAKSNLGVKAPSRYEISGVIFLHFEVTVAFCLTSHHFYLPFLQNQSTDPLKYLYSIMNFWLHLKTVIAPSSQGHWEQGFSCLGCDQMCLILKFQSHEMKICHFPFKSVLAIGKFPFNLISQAGDPWSCDNWQWQHQREI